MSNRVWLGLAACLLTAGSAWAGSQFESARSTCTSINCAGMTMRGIHQRNEPFVAQVFAQAGECLRLDVSTQTTDVALLVVAPAVTFLQLNDDRDVADLRPLLALDDLPWTGWYTVLVSPFDVDTQVARFTLEYGRYPGGNPNCPAEVAVMQQFKRMGGQTEKALSLESAALEAVQSSQ